MRQPVKCPRTGLWLARYTTPDGTIVQIGRFARKHDAQKAIAEATKRGLRPTSAPLVVEFFEDWLVRFPRHPRTQATNAERIRRYILPHLPHKGRIPIDQIRRASLRNVQTQLLGKGLAKETIDGAFSSLSAMLRDAVDDELIEANPAHGIRVRANDPRLKPAKDPRARRAIPPDEVAAFLRAVDPRHHAVCLTPFLTGARPSELFALTRADLDRARNTIFVHQTVDRYGHLEPGLKTTHHVRDREARGRWTLFPKILVALVDGQTPHFDGRLYPSPRGKHWSHRNFYRDVWEPAQQASGTDFALYDARHTFSSRLLAAGVPLVEVAAWMGHSLRAGGEQLNTTARVYAHPTGESRTLALRELETFARLVNRLAKRPSSGGVRAKRQHSVDAADLRSVRGGEHAGPSDANGDQSVTNHG
ncbi:MAG: tyrosine-type recombinase/integrase [Steroidobacteraceae bacterium]